MATLDVTPASLRDAGSTISQARQELQEAQTGTDPNQGTPISTGGFEPGQRAQQLLFQKLGQLDRAANVIYGNYQALSDALGTVAVAYESADQREAAEIASVNPAATPHVAE